jgi:hypothetical protein
MFYSDFNVCCKDVSTFDLVWICDVLHHIPPSVGEEVMRKIVRMTDLIIIKDIDARHTFGNFMNRLQDKLVNGETVYTVDPRQTGNFLEANGYTVSEYYIPKFWYPHFLLIAKRVKQ